MFGSREQEPPPVSSLGHWSLFELGDADFGRIALSAQSSQAGDASWFEARVDAAQCTHYLCPRTLSCVSKPSHCPCPFPQQIRCSYGDSSSSAKDHANRAGAHLTVSMQR